MPIFISFLGLCSFGELLIDRSSSNMRPKLTIYSWSDRSQCMCDTHAGIQSLPRVQRGNHRMAGSGCGIRRFDCYYCTITTICSRGVTRDGVNTFEQVFTAYKSVQIRCIFGRAVEILKFRCAFGHF